MLIDSSETHRQIKALCALGWPQYELASVFGVSEGYVSHLLAQPTIRHTTAAKVGAAYAALCSRPGPSEKARRIAAAKGWTP